MECRSPHNLLTSKLETDSIVLALPDVVASDYNNIGDAVDILRMHVIRRIEQMAHNLDTEEGAHVMTVALPVQNMLFALEILSSHLHTKRWHITQR